MKRAWNSSAQTSGWKDELQELCEAVDDLLATAGTPRPLYALDGDDDVPVSFDGEWRAFIGCSKGYNRPEGRTYLPDNLKLIRRVLPHLLAKSRSSRAGGRFFFNRSGVYRRLNRPGAPKVLVVAFQPSAADQVMRGIVTAPVA